MNEIINKLFLAGNKFIDSVDFCTVLIDNLLKTKKEHKHLKKQETQDIFITKKKTKKNWTKLACCFRDKIFNIAKNENMMDLNVHLLSLVHNFFDKVSSGSAIRSEIMPNQ